jgi:hypothetical protein
MSKFDAYWATFWGEEAIFQGDVVPRLFDSVIVEFARRLGAEIDQPQYKLPGGYAEAFNLVKDGDVLCHFLTGGSGSAAGSHGIRVQGAASPQVAKLIRELVPQHGLSRVDVAEDYCGEGVFDFLVGLAEGVALEHRVELRREGAGWYDHQRDKGRTLYVGSRKSAVFMRIYERGKKLLGEGQQADPNYVRVEIEIKPSSKAKRLLGFVEPDAFWGAAAWTKALYVLMGSDELERIKVGTVWSKPDMERTIQALARQYGAALMRLREQAGSAEEVFAVIQEAMDGSREVKQALKRCRESEAVETIEDW